MLHIAHGYVKVNEHVIQRCCLCGTQLVKLDYGKERIPEDLAIYKPGTWVWIEQDEEGVVDHRVIDPPLIGMKCLNPGLLLDRKQSIHTYLCMEV